MTYKPLAYNKVTKKVKKAGYMFVRKAGSHEIWWNESVRKTCVIPYHKEVKPGTVKSIIKQMGITEKEFWDL